MTARNQKLSVAVLALAGAAWLVWLAFPRREAAPATVSLDHATPALGVAAASSRPAAAPVAVADAPPTTRAVEISAAPGQPAAIVFQPAAPAPVQNETAATARMYAAHAPLRTPEVADPDSAANRQILQTMVFKALARSATPPAPVSAKP